MRLRAVTDVEVIVATSTTSAWSDLYPARHTTLDINTSLPGNFVVETSVVIGSSTNRTMVPTLIDSFVQAGFVIRDPASAPFRQRWIMYNLGFQDIAVAREIKTGSQREPHD